ncbi:MAG: 16S rRNA (guanine(966)-N(2))-methyltransferase RsmD [Oscillospiraceae bacterium]|jgi:16S rRNA (guanine(966)-N(2))-methyltransferase RsmD
MRVISGVVRGKKLKALEGLDTRPTSDRVKEAIFSIIQFDLPEASVLDLFGGSGQLGIEALSRGAKKVTFVDSSKAACDIITENLKLTGFLDMAKVVNISSDDFLKSTKGGFDIVFLDPPYKKAIIESTLPLLGRSMNIGGIIICEHEAGLELPEKAGQLSLVKKYKYGRISLTRYIVGEE